MNKPNKKTLSIILNKYDDYTMVNKICSMCINYLIKKFELDKYEYINDFGIKEKTITIYYGKHNKVVVFTEQIINNGNSILDDMFSKLNITIDNNDICRGVMHGKIYYICMVKKIIDILKNITKNTENEKNNENDGNK